jgi:hypothetical protein
MDNRPARVARPWWVKIALWGISSRVWAWISVWLCVVLAISCVAYSFWDRRFRAGLVFIFAAWWYLRAIKWADAHSGWRSETKDRAESKKES